MCIVQIYFNDDYLDLWTFSCLLGIFLVFCLSIFLSICVIRIIHVSVKDYNLQYSIFATDHTFYCSSNEGTRRIRVWQVSSHTVHYTRQETECNIVSFSLMFFERFSYTWSSTNCLLSYLQQLSQNVVIFWINSVCGRSPSGYSACDSSIVQ